ncbi:RecD-like DNA helicase YrrC [Lentilactobacillus farraginis DSM 18382 = JCM 14108]|nr:RecD-like DNA helicase YrrC [Lentilactobacillus farraginis DSM 18382 = JCM 14108]
MVILPIVHQYSRMLQRNLLYTAVTRASDFLIMLGEKQAFEQCVRSLSVNRKTSLVARLVAAIGISSETSSAVSPVAEVDMTPAVQGGDSTDDGQPNELPKRLTEEVIARELIDPMIGMAGVTPAQFEQGPQSVSN